MTFSEEELTAIVQEHFERKESEVEQKGPKEGEWFKVNPASIDQRLFENERTDERQEHLRFYIQRSFDYLKGNPENNKAFKTFIPSRDKDHYSNPKASKLKNFASQIGDHMGYWWEWALMLAQRIANGESWESLCNVPDTANWYLLVEFPMHSKIVGGSIRSYYNPSPSNINSYAYWDSDIVESAVPLVVDYDD